MASLSLCWVGHGDSDGRAGLRLSVVMNLTARRALKILVQRQREQVDENGDADSDEAADQNVKMKSEHNKDDEHLEEQENYGDPFNDEKYGDELL